MKGTCCFFIGHRDAPSTIFPILLETVERHVTEYGIREFFVGRYGQFDSMAANAVIAAKRNHPQITLVLLLPYHPTERSVPLPEGFDDSLYPAGMETVPRKAAIVRANRYMVARCSHLIAYAWHPASYAVNPVEYAKTIPHCMVTNLADQIK